MVKVLVSWQLPVLLPLAEINVTVLVPGVRYVNAGGFLRVEVFNAAPALGSPKFQLKKRALEDEVLVKLTVPEVLRSTVVGVAVNEDVTLVTATTTCCVELQPLLVPVT